MRHALLAAALALLLAACAGMPVARYPIAVERGHAEAMARMLSDYRAARGLPRVRVDSRLMAAAEEQARAVAALDRLDHSAAGSFSSRLERNGAAGRRAGENLSAGDRTPAEAFASWKASSGHHANMLMPEATRIGFVEARAPESRYKRFYVLVLASE